MVIDSVIIWTLFAVPFYYISTFYVRLIVPLMFGGNSSQAQFIVHIMLVVWTVFQVSVFLKPYSSPPGNHIDCNNIDNDNNNIDTFTSKVK